MLADKGSGNITKTIVDELLHLGDDELVSGFDRSLTGSGGDNAIQESGHGLCQIAVCFIISLMIDHMPEDFVQIDLILYHDGRNRIDDNLVTCPEMSVETKSEKNIFSLRRIGCVR